MAWGLEGIAERYGACVVRCNDRAPARHSDEREQPRVDSERDASLGVGPGWKRRVGRARGCDPNDSSQDNDVDPDNIRPPRRWGGPQRSCSLPLREYITYLKTRPGSGDIDRLGREDAPFYCNGWRAFEVEVDGRARDQDKTMASAFPRPYFTAAVDHTREITRQTHRALLPKADSRTAEALVTSLDDMLSKVFVGPAGTVTRLHQDAGDAHAWLGQVQGRKLFVCYPPDDASHLYPIQGETETVQSAVDPLIPQSISSSVDRALYWAHARPVVFVLEPGEVVLVPRGWWHYAAALDLSVTVMRNFYHAGTNAEALVKTIIAKARGTVLCCG